MVREYALEHVVVGTSVEVRGGPFEELLLHDLGTALRVLDLELVFVVKEAHLFLRGMDR